MNISTEQRTRLRTSFHGLNVREANIGVTTVRVGIDLPRTVTEYWEPVPSDIIAIVPEWRSYRFVRIHDEFVIVDPDSYRVVYVFED